MLEGRSNLKRVVVFKEASEAVVCCIVHVGSSFNGYEGKCAMHLEMLSNKSVIFINKATLSVHINGGLSRLCFISIEKISFHGQDSLFLSGFHFSERLVYIILDPGQVLLSWVSKREDVARVSKNIVLKFF